MGAADAPRLCVDSACRVNGVDNLRAIDAAPMPDLPRANPHPICALIGERMAGRLRDGSG